ncbi:nickel pincer cofactor biosynthesis protein LarC [Halovenus sp. WSH3]|uniref:Putative nickel insertion protein n=1 Tax=Halovenus carboxidivorans TaxID=2692199 RepID=A0A6B0T6H7_9EURY|nr:nickel pincer cofactor biosynthesis protein LarC [Halovenus carboxidivorans]MXR50882.1 nickel pincer cofactor biosynthesis protein LarC [Halovenus carboxidivorans]
MQTLAFDPRLGASGDMLLAALIDVGADPDALAPVEASLDLTYEISNTTRNGIAATDVTVLLDEGGGDHDSHDHEHDHGGHENKSHGDHDGHSHDHDDHDHTHAEGAGPTRTYGEVVAIIEEMDLPASVEADALDIVRRLGEAEAGVHGTDLAETHFHEVGADDAIADIVGAALLFDDLDPDRIVTTPVATGGGDVSMSHGTYPVPVPAVLELAEGADWSLRSGPVDAELLTPTGAAILATYADGIERLPTLDIDGSGYGAGGYTFEDHPNVLRVIRGTGTEGLSRDPVTVLETNLDDATPEELGGLQETLSEAGALDVSVLPATMKKSRPGHLVKVIVKPEDADRVARRLAVETGTLGVREHGRGHRLIADRETRTVSVETDAGSVDIGVKVARIGEEVFDVSAEFDDAQSAAADTTQPIRELMRRAEAAAREQL